MEDVGDPQPLSRSGPPTVGDRHRPLPKSGKGRSIFPTGYQGADRVIVIDQVPERLPMAREGKKD